MAPTPIPVTHQLKAAPACYEKPVSQFFEVYVHPETNASGQPLFDEKGQVIHRLNRRGRRNELRLQRRRKPGKR